MSMHTGTLPAGHGRKPFWRRQQFWRVTLPVLAVLAVLIGGVITWQAIYGSNGTPNAAQGWGVTYPNPTPPQTVKLDSSIRPLVNRFIHTAVARRNLAAAYAMSGPQIRQGMTLKQYLTGTIAVVPYPINAKTKIHIKVDKSYAKAAQLEVFLVTPGVNAHSPHTFYLDLVKIGGKWYVNTWVPRWTPPIPTQPGR